MSKPEDITQGAFKAAWKCAETVLRNLPDDYGDVTFEIETIALAFLSAEKRGEDREREAIIDLASEYVWDEHALAQATPIGLACHHQSLEIISAIRNRTATQETT